MRVKLHVFLALVLVILIQHSVMSQSKSKQDPLPVVVYDENVNDPLTSDELLKIKEVYGDRAENDILSHSQRLKDVKNILRNRVEIVDAGDKDMSSFTKLSQVELFNDFTPNLSRDLNFNPSDFNPLKYKFDFYSRNSAIYSVDNTIYYIVIKSQHD